MKNKKIRGFSLFLFAAAVVFGILFMQGCSNKEVKITMQSRVSTVQKKVVNKRSSSAVSSSSSIPSSVPELSSSPKTAQNHMICIDPGHQKKADLSEEPVAPGASVLKIKVTGGAKGAATKTPEYELNMIVGNKVEQRLLAQGYKVVMTRTGNDSNTSNIGRAQAADNAKADLFVRIHADSTDSPAVHGITVLVPGNQYIKDSVMLSESRRAGNCLLESLIEITGAKSRGISVRDDMTGFNWSKVPVVLVEMGFMSNPDEDQLMSTDEYRNKLADGIINGINNYFKK